jgi:hypothetical protein
MRLPFKINAKNCNTVLAKQTLFQRRKSAKDCFRNFNEAVEKPPFTQNRLCEAVDL